MSLSAALSSAVSGLTAASRSAQTISSNVANALTPGYASRTTELESASFGGVRLSGISRRENIALTTDRRMADAEVAGQDARLTGLGKVVAAIGSAASDDSISARLVDFEGALITTASDPGSVSGLDSLFQKAATLASRINEAGTAIQAARLDAETGIASSVARLNQGLARVDKLNVEIARRSVTGGDINPLVDQRRQIIDGISDIVPIRQIQRENGRIALITGNGQLLLDSRPVEISFSPTPAVTPSMGLGAPLGTVLVGGREIDMAKPDGKLAGGELSALFDLRDRELPGAQAQLDAFAWELGQRLEADALDPTTPPGAPGLFTDAGATVGSAPSAGLAQRLQVNAAVDPSNGGETWRLRDGLNAAAPGEAGDARLLNALSEALSLSRVPGASALGPTARSLGGLAVELSARGDSRSFAAETDLTFSAARADTLLESELSLGVDTDDEMRRLLLVEQAYAANARVIDAAGRMIDRLMEI